MDKSKIVHENKKEIRYIKLPYIGEFSKIAKCKIQKLIDRFCKANIKINLVFDTSKIGSYFSTKDTVPNCFKSSVIYKFCCQECNSCYVGRTHKYFNTRLDLMNIWKRTSYLLYINILK